MRPALLACALLAGALLAACGGGTDDHDAVATAPAHFTLRGRWPATPPVLGYWLEDHGAPLPAADWHRAIERAAARWQATGVVGFRAAASAADADVVLGWRAGHHGACEPFGISTTVAHSGPVGRGTFVHFDRERVWSIDGATGHSLYHTALHELGHVLGLGHSEATTAIMRTGPLRDCGLAAADLMGLWSLYGGGTERSGDLRIVDGGGRVLARLHGVSPPACTEHAVFDADGDGRDEVLVWRTDRDGHGALMIYQFADGALPLRTIGPAYGVSSAGALAFVVRAPAGERLLVTALAPERLVVRQFDEQGLLAQFDAARLPPDLLAQALATARRDGPPRAGDLDGDGSAETVVLVR